MAGNRESFNRAMNQGHSAAWDQTWDKAAGYYRQALQEFPEEPKALTSLALALYELGEYKEALHFYQRVARSTPEDPIPMEKVAELFERMGRVDQSIDAYMRSAELYVKNKEVNKCIDLWLHVISINPEYMAAHSRLGMLYERLGKKGEAIKSYLVVASLLQHSGDVQKAAQAVIHSLQLDPENVEANHALSLLKMGHPLPKPARSAIVNEIPPAFRPKPAVQKEEPEMKRMDPVQLARQKATAELARLLFESMEAGGSENVAEIGAILRGGTPQMTSAQFDATRIVASLSQIVDYLSRKEDSLALTDLANAQLAGFEHPAAYFIAGLLHTECGQKLEAVANLQHAANHSELGLAANLLLGETLRDLQRIPEASAALLEALKLADMHAVLPEQAESLGEMYVPLIEAQTQPNTDGANEDEARVRFCATMIEMLHTPDWLERIRHTRTQLPAGPDGTVTPVADLLMEGMSGEIVDSLLQIQKLAKAQKYHPAMEEAFLAVGVSPFYLPLHIAMGDLLYQQGQTASALEKYGTIVRVYVARDERKRAIVVCRKMVELAPMDLQTRMMLIKLLSESGDAAQAVVEFTRISDIYYSMADLSMARSTLTQALQTAHENNLDQTLRAEILSRVADIDMQSLDWRSALRTCEQIRLLTPDNEQNRLTLVELNFRLNQANQANAEINNYVKFLLDRQQHTQAVRFIEKAAENHSDQPIVMRILADAYRQSGRAPESIHAYETASSLFLKAGNRPAAVESLMALLALNPPNAADYQQQLVQLRSNN